jgi:hypothetical protein
MDGHALVELIRNSLVDALTGAFWAWVGSWLVTAAVAARRWLKGLRGPVTYGLIGAAAAWVAAALLAVLLKWWGPTLFYLFIGISASLVFLARPILMAMRRRARLASFEKGLVEHLRERRTADKVVGRVSAAIASEIAILGKIAETGTAGFQAAPTAANPQRHMENIVDRAARNMTRASMRMAGHTRRLRDVLGRFIDAQRGIRDFTVATGGVERIASFRTEVQTFRDSVVETRTKIDGFVATVKASPKMSQRYNMAKEDVVVSLQDCVHAFAGAVAFCDETLASLG